MNGLHKYVYSITMYDMLSSFYLIKRLSMVWKSAYRFTYMYTQTLNICVIYISVVNKYVFKNFCSIYLRKSRQYLIIVLIDWLEMIILKTILLKIILIFFIPNFNQIQISLLQIYQKILDIAISAEALDLQLHTRM